MCLLAGIAIVVSHNLLDLFWFANALFEERPLWAALHAQMSFHAGPFQLAFIYPILAWIGVMLVGFGASELFQGVEVGLSLGARPSNACTGSYRRAAQKTLGIPPAKPAY